MAGGYVLEVLGLAIAAVGLRKTWADNADGLHFLAGTPRLYRFWAKLRGPRVLQASGAINAVSTIEATGEVTVGLARGDRSVEARLDALEQDLKQALDTARAAHQRVDTEQRERRRAVESLQERVETVENSTRAYARRTIVEGVPLAMMGLCLAGFGLVLQGLATWGTWTPSV